MRDRRPSTSRDANTGNHNRTFPARRDTLPAVAQFIADICAADGVPRKACLRLTLLVEELFTNTVVHGHGDDTEAPVSLSFAIRPDEVELTYEDTAPPHDPFARVRVPDDTAGVEERPVGGLGVLLVAAMAERVEYAHVGGRNRISLVMPTGR
ncbi:MAG TPA: ATP-binding protein [Candidatus Binatia bacterium]|nr:ATP-binding protein [Candidatus Binatia bacterium]